MAKSRRLSPGDQVPAGIATDVDEQKVDLTQLWKEGPTLLTFLRHFG
jgi:hypothetical protein